jgi:hypothetical protein
MFLNPMLRLERVIGIKALSAGLPGVQYNHRLQHDCDATVLQASDTWSVLTSSASDHSMTFDRLLFITDPHCGTESVMHVSHACRIGHTSTNISIILALQCKALPAHVGKLAMRCNHLQLHTQHAPQLHIQQQTTTVQRNALQ